MFWNWLFGKRNRQEKAGKAAAEAADETVSEAITDAVTSANVSNLGLNTAYSLDQSLLAQSQAHGVLFANMVSEQQRLVSAGQTAAIKSAADIFGISPDDILPPPDNP